MNRPLLSLTSRTLVLVTLSFIPALADSWMLPGRKQYCSVNKQFCFVVFPKKLESQLKFFQDKSEGKKDAGAVANSKGNFCQGGFFKSGGDSQVRPLWSRQLVNEVAPVSALVSDSGKYVVTFDNWHTVGYGPDVVVIYGPEGKLIKQLGLEDFLSRDDMLRLRRSVSSIWWAGYEPQHYVDESREVLVLRVELRVRSSNQIDLGPESKTEIREIQIALGTGEIVKAAGK